MSGDGEDNPLADSLVAVANGFGSAIRMNWGDIDGRTIKASLASAMRACREGSSVSFSLGFNGVCPEELCWTDDCSEHAYPDQTALGCPHADAACDYTARPGSPSGETGEAR